MNYGTSLDDLGKAFKQASESGMVSERGLMAVWGVVIAATLIAQTERLEAIATSLEDLAVRHGERWSP